MLRFIVIVVVVVLICGPIISVSAQTSSSKWQPGTITAVVTHSYGPGEPAGDTAQYDVSVKVGNTVYVVLYTPHNGSNAVEYRRGFELLVLVGTDVLTFNTKGELSGSTTEVPILRKEVLPAESGPDLSKLPSQYFSIKMENLSQKLNLSEEQQGRIKPIVEQETAEMGRFWANPALSFDDKVKEWKKVVRSSDKQMTPLLSADQVQKLQELRKEQKEKLKRLGAEQKQKTG
jgi:hypothetical protein